MNILCAYNHNADFKFKAGLRVGEVSHSKILSQKQESKCAKIARQVKHFRLNMET